MEVLYRHREESKKKLRQLESQMAAEREARLQDMTETVSTVSSQASELDDARQEIATLKRKLEDLQHIVNSQQEDHLRLLELVLQMQGKSPQSTALPSDPALWKDHLHRYSPSFFSHELERKYPCKVNSVKRQYSEALKKFEEYLIAVADAPTSKSVEGIYLKQVGLIVALSYGIPEWRYVRFVEEDPSLGEGQPPTVAQVKAYAKEHKCENQKHKRSYSKKDKQGNDSGRL